MHKYEGKVVLYFRINTDRQTKVGNSLEVQRKRVIDYLNCGRWELVAEFTEFERGWKFDRPGLEKAFAACERHDAKLIISEFGSIFHNPMLIITLMASRVNFIALDNPHANKLNANPLKMVAEYWR